MRRGRAARDPPAPAGRRAVAMPELHCQVPGAAVRRAAGAVREAATRDEQGRPVCPHCLITDPANHEDCVNCGRRRPVSDPRTRTGPSARPAGPAGAGRARSAASEAPCETSMADRAAVVQACQQRWAPVLSLRQRRPGRRRAPWRSRCASACTPDSRVLARLPGLRAGSPHPAGRPLPRCAAADSGCASCSPRARRQHPPRAAGVERQPGRPPSRPRPCCAGWPSRTVAAVLPRARRRRTAA